MAGKAYIGVGGVARKVKNIYIGVNGVARRIKKIYMGVGGVARQCWSADPELHRHPTMLSLSSAGGTMTTAKAGAYTFWTGIAKEQPASSKVESFSQYLTHSIPASLGEARVYITSASLFALGSSYAFFAGGDVYGISSVSKRTDAVEIYNGSQTRLSPMSLSGARCEMGGASNTGCVFFGGGRRNDDSNGNSGFVSVVECINYNLVKKILTNLSYARCDLAANTVGDYILFAGGRYLEGFGEGKGTNLVEVYNSSLTRLNRTCTLIDACYGLEAASVGGYALFGGGYNGRYIATVTAFNSALTRTTVTPLSVARGDFSAATLSAAKSYALFTGGEINGSRRTATVDAYDSALTRTAAPPLNTARYGCSAIGISYYTSESPYVLVGGGTDSDRKRCNEVDVYEFT